ncbi:MAG: type II secretion system F family protein [Pseudomonadota bacterium]
MDFGGDTLLIVIAGLAFLCIAGLGFALTGESGAEKASKRARQIAANEAPDGRRGGTRNDPNAARKKQTQQMLKKLREQDETRRKTLTANDIQSKIDQAGLEMSAQIFWFLSIVLAGLAAFGMWYSGAEGPPMILGFQFKSQPAMILMAAFVGGFGFPRAVLGFLTNSRNKKLMNQFADGIDIIVRGVKSGLPLTECLRIIARESPAPLGPEFKLLTDNLQMGMTTDRALQQFYKRVPLPEVNFFVIVLSIQAKAGGNLSEALGNLSTVIRSRKMMREKIKALSSEAKASAYIIASLPFAVGFMVYLTTPEYISELWTSSGGHTILFVGACMYSIGIFVMRKMINFDF